MVNFNVSNFYSNLHLPSLDSLTQKAKDIFADGVTSFSQASNMERAIAIGTVGTLSLLATAKLFKYLKRQSIEQRHLIEHSITLPKAADIVFKGHRQDATDKNNRFASLDSNPNFPFACLTAKESMKLRSFLMKHLKTQLKEKSDLIIERTESWAQSFNDYPSWNRFHRISWDEVMGEIDFSRKIFIVRTDEVGRFFLSLCWNLFLGSGEAPEVFKQVSSVDSESDRYTTIEPQLDLLKDALQESGLTDEKLVLQTFKDTEVGFISASNLLSTSLFALLYNIELQELVFQEMQQSIDEGKTLAEAAKESSLIVKILAESLRLFENIAPPPRLNAREDFWIENPTPSQKNVLVKKGDDVAVDLRAMAMNPELVGPRPDLFDTERKYLEKLKNFQAAPWRPFAKGFHSCPAAQTVQSLSTLTHLTQSM